jgi:hypothetical protein
MSTRLPGKTLPSGFGPRVFLCSHFFACVKNERIVRPSMRRSPAQALTAAPASRPNAVVPAVYEVESRKPLVAAQAGTLIESLIPACAGMSGSVR